MSAIAMNIIISIIIAIICGCISSYLVWYVPARKIMPEIKCDSFIQLENKRKIKVVNESKDYDAFDLICYIEYIDKNDNDILSETSMIPILERNSSNNINLKTVSLPQRTPQDGRPSRKMFVESQTKKLKVTITYQNKYGSRMSTSPKYWDYN